MFKINFAKWLSSLSRPEIVEAEIFSISIGEYPNFFTCVFHKQESIGMIYSDGFTVNNEGKNALV